MEKIQTPKDQLREKYDNKAKRIEIGAFLVWCTAAALLSIGVYGGLKSISPNPFRDSQAAIQYNDTDKTLNYLIAERGELAMPDIPYKPESIKPYLEDVFGDTTKVAASLDAAIKQVEEDIKEIEQHPDYKAYKAYEVQKMASTSKNGSRIYFGLLILELDMLGGIILLKRNQRRERAELASLGNQ